MKYAVRMDSRTRKALDRLPDDMHGRVVRKLKASIRLENTDERTA